MKRNCWDRIQFGQPGATEMRERQNPDRCHENNRKGSIRITKLEKVFRTTITTPKILENSFSLKISIRKIRVESHTKLLNERERERGGAK